MDDEFKGILRFLSIVLLLSLIWAWLTKAGLIPNWFDVEILSPQEEISLGFTKKLTLKIDWKEIKIIENWSLTWIESEVENTEEKIEEKAEEIFEGKTDGKNNSEGDFFIIDVNDSSYPQWCNTPGLPNPEKCILRTSNNYCIAPYQTESTQTRYEANKYCNSLNVLWLSRELPYAHPNEKNMYWMNLIDVESKIYRLNANWSEKPWHYRAFPETPTFENCTLRWNCWNEYWPYKLSVRCVAPCGKMPSEVKNVDDDDSLKNNWLKNEKEQDDKTIKWNICPEWYTYWTYSNTIKWYANIGYPPNRNRENYDQNFENWKKSLKEKEVKEFTFGPFEWCIPDDWKLEKCTDSGTYDYVFCTINMIPLNNECPQWYSFVKAWVAWPYDLCQWKSDFIIDRKGYIHTYQIPLQDDCEFFAQMGVIPGDGHCDKKNENVKNNVIEVLPKGNWMIINRWMSYKPIIYLYPKTESKVNVKLWTPENLSHTYPIYNSERWWNVIAQPNGELENLDNWRKLYALYWEWKSDIETNFDEWFVVAWKDIIPFLEEKLAILWLNEREAEEFIVYWLPQMENNKYNVIRFETIEEQNENMPLNITPTPDTVIRVMMDWKAIEEPIEVPEQQLTTPERNGFTVVEWWWSLRN